jgi:AAA ATPase domain
MGVTPVTGRAALLREIPVVKASGDGTGARREPYRVGFSQVPPVLAGRDDVLEAADEAIAAAALDAHTPTPLLLVGARGVGKTVLLEEIANRAAAAHGWSRMHVERTSSSSFLEQPIAETAATLTLLRGTRPGNRFRATDAVVRAQIAGIGREIHLTKPDEPSATSAIALQATLGELASDALERRTGVVLTIDELQLVRREHATVFGAAPQRAIGANWPIVVAAAGLPAMRDPDRLPTYFERAEWHHLGALDRAATLHAPISPAAQAGRPLAPEAAEYLAEQTGGYPYTIQPYGHHARRASHGQREISLQAANRAAKSAGAELARGPYARRWAQASPRERRYLRAVVKLQATSAAVTGAAVAQRLGTVAKNLASARGRLIEKGTLTSAGDALFFTVPGMGAYILGLGDDDRSHRPLGPELGR